jgi:hypothetical protein
VQQIDHQRCDPRTILHRRAEGVGERAPRLRSAAGAPAVMGTMFGDNERPRLGQIENLAGAVPSAPVRAGSAVSLYVGRGLPERIIPPPGQPCAQEKNRSTQL